MEGLFAHAIVTHIITGHIIITHAVVAHIIAHVTHVGADRDADKIKGGGVGEVVAYEMHDAVLILACIRTGLARCLIRTLAGRFIDFCTGIP